MMTPEFLKLPLEERENWIPKWTEIAKEFGLKLLFHGTTIGVAEHVVFVYESPKYSENYFKFLRAWLELGTLNAGKLIEYTRTVTVN